MPEQEAAVVLNQDGPEKVNAEELTNANPEGGEVDPQANANEGDAEGHKRLGGWQRKIEKLKRENETLLEVIRKGGGNAQAQQSQPAPVEAKPPVKPNKADPQFQGPDGWDKYEDARDKYFEDLTDHKAKIAIEGYKAESQKQTEQQTVANGWAAQCAEAMKELPDFKEVAFSEDVPMSPPMMEAIVTSEYGAKIAYELGKNPDEAERISKLTPVAAIREIGKIESRIAGTKPAAEEDKEPPAATTRAPRPPQPVRRQSGASAGEPGPERPYSEWLAWRKADLARK